jgi:antitoxin CcdA
MVVKYAHKIMRTEIAMPTVPKDPVNNRPRSRPLSKRATNLSLSADVLDAAKALQINVSQVCDVYLRDVVRREQERRWRTEHADFIAAYNASIETQGLPLDEWKTF